MHVRMKAAIKFIVLAALVFVFVTSLSSGRVIPLHETGLAAMRPFSDPSGEITEAGLLPSEIRLIDQVCDEFNVDPRIIVALIKQESQFDRNALSERGAMGLMQIMPVTTLEMNEKLHIGEGTTLESHLSAGVYYFSKLLELFPGASPEDQLKLALAAYNAGPARVYDAQKLAAYLNANPNSWNSIKNALPLLSKRYYSLHQAVWGDGRPENGFFGSSRQTIMFVENVVRFYGEYKSQSVQ
jgi:membrane-bound lytic murein transglycosylase F